MIYNKIRVYGINYFYGFKNHSMSEEEDQIKLKDIVFVDFEPLLLFRKYKRFTRNSDQDIKQHRGMMDGIELMFDFELEISKIKQNCFWFQQLWVSFFNYVDLFFQLYSGAEDETYCKIVVAMDKLPKYYDKRPASATVILKC